MTEIIVPLSHLRLLGGSRLESLPIEQWPAEIATMFQFLPGVPEVTIDGENAVIRFPETTQNATREAAARFAEQATRKAQKGEYPRAIELFERALAADPLNTSVRRDLAMACMEAGRMADAEDHLIEVLRLDPTDAWAFVILGNLFSKHRNDTATALKFYRRALELKPDDAWALNGIAAAEMEAGHLPESIAAFEQVIRIQPDFANAWCGKALAEVRQNKPEAAESTLIQLFAQGKKEDARTGIVFDEARRIFFSVQTRLASKRESDAFKEIENLRRRVEESSGYPVEILEENLGHITGQARMAWKHGRDRHVIAVRASTPPLENQHVMAHELSHIGMEAEARVSGSNRWFTTTAATREIALRELAPDLKRIERSGFSEEATGRLVLDLLKGISSFLFNCPLDMIIEQRLWRDCPSLRSSQWLSLHSMAEEAARPTLDPRIVAVTPKKILHCTQALNGAYALFLDRLLPGAAIAAVYSKLPSFKLARQLDEMASACIASPMRPGDEYQLVDEFARLLGLEEWYEWMPDPGTHEITVPSAPSGTTNPELLREKLPAAVWYLLGALQRYERLTAEGVRAIAFEIGLLGQSGLDYADAEKKYTLKSIPGEKFSGLHLMCLMYAGFKRIAPEADQGMDLEDAYLQALGIFNNPNQSTP